LTSGAKSGALSIATPASQRPGQPNHFYAFEGGQIIGTPFTPETAVMPEAEVLRLAMLSGSAFMVMREPKVVPNGQNPVR
jgi:hypothetical protein